MVEFVLKVVDWAARSDIIPNSDVFVLGRDSDFLRQETQAKFGKFDFAVVELLFPKNNTEKSGLAGAVHANYSDLVAGFEMEITVIVDDFGAVGEVEVGGFHLCIIT